MPRYATLITTDDGAEIVSAIGEFESSGPLHRAGRVEEVPPGVRIGMVRGGPLEAIAGFGFPRQGLDRPMIASGTAKVAATAGRPTASPGEVAKKSKRAKPRKKPARNRSRARAAAIAPTPDAGAHG
ncbi:hypothetical protein AB6802_09415 [Mesorhizobium sp. RCC_202]|uniref:hypothetical protein n=1 Tax=Mesorhizobium sp. RCC_202 TaxID=3239222 RepID=UPI0035251E36